MENFHKNMRILDEDERANPENYNDNIESLDDFYEISNKPTFLEISIKNNYGYLEMELQKIEPCAGGSILYFKF